MGGSAAGTRSGSVLSRGQRRGRVARGVGLVAMPSRVVAVAVAGWLAVSSAGPFAGSVARAETVVDEDTLRLSRDGAVRALLEQNPEVRRARLELKRRRAEERAARGAWAWVLSSDLRLQYAEDPANSGISKGVAVNEVHALSTALATRFPFGLQLSVGLDQTISRSSFPIELEGFTSVIERGPNWGSGFTLSATQPLLQGFGEDVGRVAEALASAQVSASELEIEQRASLELARLLTAYSELGFAWAEEELRVRSLERTRLQLEISSAEAEAGRVAPFEVDLVRERLATNEETLLLSHARVRQRSRELARILGADPARAPLVVPEAPLDAVALDGTIDALCARASDANPELVALQSQVRASRIALRSTEDRLRPRLDVTAGWTQRGLGETFGSSWGQLVGLEARTAFGLLSFSMPLGNVAAEADHERAQVVVEQAEFEVSQLKSRLCWDVRELHASLSLMDDRERIARSRLELAHRSWEAEQERFRLGLSTVQAGLEAMENLEAAELAVLRIRTDREVAWWQIRHLTGRLLDAFDVAGDGTGAAP